jgi:hypothetical protein
MSTGDARPIGERFAISAAPTTFDLIAPARAAFPGISLSTASPTEEPRRFADDVVAVTSRPAQ